MKHAAVTRRRAGSVERSALLRATLRAIRSGRGRLVSSDEIRRVTGSVAVHSDVSRLRTLEFPVSKARHVFTTRSGRKVYGYRMERA